MKRNSWKKRKRTKSEKASSQKWSERSMRRLVCFGSEKRIVRNSCRQKKNNSFLQVVNECHLSFGRLSINDFSWSGVRKAFRCFRFHLCFLPSTSLVALLFFRSRRAVKNVRCFQVQNVFCSARTLPSLRLCSQGGPYSVRDALTFANVFSVRRSNTYGFARSAVRIWTRLTMRQSRDHERWDVLVAVRGAASCTICANRSLDFGVSSLKWFFGPHDPHVVPGS